MLNISNYLRSALLDEAIGGVAFTPDTNLRIRLFSTTLDRDGVGTELVADGYAFVEIDNDTTSFPLATDGAKANAVQFDFPTATADWDAILAVGIFDTDGNLYFYQNYSSPKYVLDTQIWTYSPGEITFDFS
jgi:hypothetical protein